MEHLELNIYGYKFLIPSFLLNNIPLHEMVNVSKYFDDTNLDIINKYLITTVIEIERYKLTELYQNNQFKKYLKVHMSNTKDLYKNVGMLKIEYCTINPITLIDITPEKCLELLVRKLVAAYKGFKAWESDDNKTEEIIDFHLENQYNKLKFLDNLKEYTELFQADRESQLQGKDRVLYYISKKKVEVLSIGDANKVLNVSLPTNQFTWSNSKTDLAELVYALAKTEIIRSDKTGKTATKKELLKFFSELFGQDITDESLLTKSMNTFKRKTDSKTFTRKLADIFDNYLEKKV